MRPKKLIWAAPILLSLVGTTMAEQNVTTVSGNTTVITQWSPETIIFHPTTLVRVWTRTYKDVDPYEVPVGVVYINGTQTFTSLEPLVTAYPTVVETTVITTNTLACSISTYGPFPNPLGNLFNVTSSSTHFGTTTISTAQQTTDATLSVPDPPSITRAKTKTREYVQPNTAGLPGPDTIYVIDETSTIEPLVTAYPQRVDVVIVSVQLHTSIGTLSGGYVYTATAEVRSTSSGTEVVTAAQKTSGYVGETGG